VRSSGSVEMDNSLITGATVFGISARGANSVVSGRDNVISGTGFRAVDARADAAPPALSESNTAHWAYHVKETLLTYLEFHPLAILWLSIILLVTVGALWTRRRRPSGHPYPESTRWTGPADDPGRHAPVLVAASIGGQDGQSWAGDHDAWLEETVPQGRGLIGPAVPDGGVPRDRMLACVVPDVREADSCPQTSRHGRAGQIDATSSLLRVDDRP
jgi:hypothetical protein